MENQKELTEQSIILTNIMVLLKRLIENIKDQNVDKDFYNDLLEVINRTADSTIIFLQKIHDQNETNETESEWV